MIPAFAAAALFLLVSLPAIAQDAPHSHPAAPAASPPGKQATGAPAVSGGAYRSPFADYRPFSEEVPPKAWRTANDEVRDAGGHIGLMKGERAQPRGHEAHGAKQPTTPAAADRK
jgi:hypothetical protein